MKHILLTLLVILLSTNLWAQEWQIIAMRGKVFANNSPIDKGALLKEGDTVTTGPASFAKIKDGKANTIMVGPKSEVVLKIITGKTKVIELLHGMVRAKLEGPKTKEHKLKINTKTASMGVRGTDFHVTYNEVNNITSSISYEGNVDFVHDKSDTSTQIKDGHVASASPDGLNLNTKMSPRQFTLLKKNEDLDFTKRKTKETNEEKIVSPTVLSNKTFEKDKNLVPVPKDLLGDEHKDFIEAESEVKSGGYLDLATGIYIAPPDHAEYDEEKGVYIPPKEFGDVDPVTGSYNPPYGLVLHPLKGFVLVSEQIEQTLRKSREFVTDVGTKVVDKTLDIAKGTKDVIVSNTGVVGQAAEKSTEFVVDSALKTGDLLASSSGKALNLVADSMNEYLYNGVLKRVSDFKKKTYLKHISATAKDRFSYGTSHRFSTLGNIDEVVKIPSFENQIYVKGAFNQKLGKIFIRPVASYEKTSYLNDEHEGLRAIKNSQSYAEVDVGFQNKFQEGQYLQAFMFFKKGKMKKFNLLEDDYQSHLRTKSFGLSKLLIGREYLTSRFSYEYLTYNYAGILSEGKQHIFTLTEILNLSEKNFANFEILYSMQDEELLTSNDVTNLGLKFNYFFFAHYYKMKLNAWLSQNWMTNDNLRFERGREIIREFGLSLKKSFGTLFHVQFDYAVNDIKSKDYRRDDRAHTFSTEALFYF